MRLNPRRQARPYQEVYLEESPCPQCAAAARPCSYLVCRSRPTGTRQEPPTGFVRKLGVDVDVRSGSRIFADDLTAAGSLILPDATTHVPGGSTVPQIQLRGGNVQANDPAEDYIQIFPLFRPFVHATQSETSMAAFGRNIVVTYNNSAGVHLSLYNGGPGLIVDQVQFSGIE
jgi:hypothetical protein